jgi:hypothetical protein
MTLAKLAAMLVLLAFGAYVGYNVAQENPPTAASICQRALNEHRLIYTVDRCIKAENEGMEDY